MNLSSAMKDSIISASNSAWQNRTSNKITVTVIKNLCLPLISPLLHPQVKSLIIHYLNHSPEWRKHLPSNSYYKINDPFSSKQSKLLRSIRTLQNQIQKKQSLLETKQRAFAELQYKLIPLKDQEDDQEDDQEEDQD